MALDENWDDTSPDDEKVDSPNESGGVQNVTPAQPEQVSPGGNTSQENSTSDEGEQQEGVKVGGLPFTPNLDGTRHYPSQQPVDTEDDPTPTPAEDPNAEQPAEASVTNEPVGR